jgi:hypothetical protein
VHYELCDWLEVQYGLDKVDNCHFAKDKSLFVELPCKLGDEVYYIGGVCEDTVEEATVIGIYIGKREIDIRIERNLNFWSENINDIFLTKEEAEAKLKEMQK